MKLIAGNSVLCRRFASYHPIYNSQVLLLQRDKFFSVTIDVALIKLPSSLNHSSKTFKKKMYMESKPQLPQINCRVKEGHMNN